MLVRVAAVVVALATLTACGAGEKRTTIAVLGKSSGGEYWLAVRHGAERQAATLGVKVLYMGEASEQDVNGQIDMLNGLIQRKVDGIALSPSDSAALSPIVKQAVAAGIKVVTIDSDTLAHDRLAYIGTNNEEAGEVAGRAMLKLLGNRKAKVATVTGPAGARNLVERLAGFKQVVGDRLVLLPPVSDGGNKDTAMNFALQTMQHEPDLAGFFSTTAIGGPALSQAVVHAGRAGAVKVISFDTTPTLIKQLKDGTVQVLIAQQPAKMGELAVAWLVKALHGQKPPGIIDTGVVAVTRDNMTLFDTPP